ncbi:MAG: hypothetical protein Q7S79_02410 [bacterium]|nr:hypothetical protein [bacterium]
MAGEERLKVRVARNFVPSPRLAERLGLQRVETETREADPYIFTSRVVSVDKFTPGAAPYLVHLENGVIMALGWDDTGGRIGQLDEKCWILTLPYEHVSRAGKVDVGHMRNAIFVNPVEPQPYMIGVGINSITLPEQSPTQT